MKNTVAGIYLVKAFNNSMMTAFEQDTYNMAVNTHDDNDLEHAIHQAERRLTRRFRKDIILANMCRCLIRVSCHVFIIIMAYLGICGCVLMLDDPKVGKHVMLLSVIMMYGIIRIGVMCCNKVDSIVTSS